MPICIRWLLSYTRLKLRKSRNLATVGLTADLIFPFLTKEVSRQKFFHRFKTEKKKKKGRFAWVVVISAKNHKRQSVTAKREKSQTPKVLTAILTLPNLT